MSHCLLVPNDYGPTRVCRPGVEDLWLRRLRDDVLMCNFFFFFTDANRHAFVSIFSHFTMHVTCYIPAHHGHCIDFALPFQFREQTNELIIAVQENTIDTILFKLGPTTRVNGVKRCVAYWAVKWLMEQHNDLVQWQHKYMHYIL